MQIGELARRSGASTRSLRHYERMSLLTSERRPNGYRDFGEDQVAKVVTIRRLLAAGLSLDAIRVIAPCHADGSIRPLCAAARVRAETELATLERRASQIEEARAALRDLLSPA